MFFRSKFYLTFRDEELEQQMLPLDIVEKETCLSTDRMTTMLGMELCGKMSYPNVFSRVDVPWPPMTGPMEAKVELHKRDTMTGYQVMLKFDQGENVSLLNTVCE